MYHIHSFIHSGLPVNSLSDAKVASERLFQLTRCVGVISLMKGWISSSKTDNMMNDWINQLNEQQTESAKQLFECK